MGAGVSLHGSNPEPLMSALGQKRTLLGVIGMSALCQKRTSASSFDQVVGNGKYAWRNSEPECLSSRQINNELEFRWAAGPEDPPGVHP
jgi:hypothetical protein